MLVQHKKALSDYINYVTRILLYQYPNSPRIRFASHYILADDWAPRTLPPSTYDSYTHSLSGGRVAQVICLKCNTTSRRVDEATQHLKWCLGLEVMCPDCQTWRKVGTKGRLLSHKCI